MKNTNDRNKDKIFASCIKPDKTAVSICKWANGCRRWGLVLAIIELVLGLILAIVTASEANGISEYTGQSSFFVFIANFLPTLINALLIYAAFYAVYLLLTALGKLVQFNRQTAAFNELIARKLFSAEINANIDTIDVYDEMSDEEIFEHEEEEYMEEQGSIVCPKCKKKIAADADFCYYCGAEIIK